MKAKFEMQPGNCPMCNSTNLAYDDDELLGTVIRYYYTCEDCDFEGAEDYGLSFISHVAVTSSFTGLEILENPE